MTSYRVEHQQPKVLSLVAMAAEAKVMTTTLVLAMVHDDDIPLKESGR